VKVGSGITLSCQTLRPHKMPEDSVLLVKSMTSISPHNTQSSISFNYGYVAGPSNYRYKSTYSDNFFKLPHVHRSGYEVFFINGVNFIFTTL
jgi:hypothetical protein